MYNEIYSPYLSTSLRSSDTQGFLVSVQILKKGVDARAVKKVILDELVARGAEYPAEHNVGHEYKARDALHQHYLDLDPTNSFNPGIGQTSKNKNWM